MASAASDRGLAPLNTQVLIAVSTRRSTRASRLFELPRVLAVPVVRFLGSAVSCDTTPDHRRNGPLPASAFRVEAHATSTTDADRASGQPRRPGR